MMIIEAPRPTLKFTRIIVSLSIIISVGIEVGALYKPLGFSNHLPTSDFAFLMLLTAPLRPPLSFPSKHELASTTFLRRSSMEEDISPWRVVMSSAGGISVGCGSCEGETSSTSSSSLSSSSVSPFVCISLANDFARSNTIALEEAVGASQDPASMLYESEVPLVLPKEKVFGRYAMNYSRKSV